MRSFTTRFTILYVAIALALLMAIMITSTGAAMLVYAQTLNATVQAAADRTAHRMGEQLARGETFVQAAAHAVRDFDHPLMRLVIYDAHHRAVAGTASAGSGETRLENVLAALGGLRAAEAVIPGGSLLVAPNQSGFERTLARYWIRVGGLGLVAIAVAFILGRGVTRRAMRPLAEVTVALRAFANGDVVPHPILTAEHDELADLAAAYRDAVLQTQRAFAARESAQLQIQQFIADAGHELRTPLTVLTGYVDALRDGIVPDPARVARVYQRMADECRRMRTLIERLIYLARLDQTESRNLREIDVAALTRQVTDASMRVAPNLAVMILTRDVAASTVVGDESELREAISNVVDNAVKYAAGAPITASVERRGERVTVEVTDLGPGIPPGDQAHAFDRFYRGSTRGTVDGSGLGLAIAKRAVERMEGSIALVSEVGHGTRVTISLPCAERPVVARREHSPVHARPAP